MRLVPVLFFASVATAALIACNFIVDAEFNGKILPGQDGALPVADCPLGNAPQDPACATCMLSSCKSQYNLICKDGNSAQRGSLDDCANHPSVTQGYCDKVFIDAGTEQTFSDPATHYYNMRVCVTKNCKPTCLTCTSMTYDRYTGDTMPQPITSAGTACAKCLLDNCQGALVGPGSAFSHCCYQDRIDDTWGPCLRPMAPDCSAIKMWAATDGGSGGCSYTLSKCAVDNCKASCGL